MMIKNALLYKAFRCIFYTHKFQSLVTQEHVKLLLNIKASEIIKAATSAAKKYYRGQGYNKGGGRGARIPHSLASIPPFQRLGMNTIHQRATP